MADWDNDRRNVEGSRESGWRGGRDWRDAPYRGDERSRYAADRPAYPDERDRVGSDRDRFSGGYGYRGERGGAERSRGGERALGSQTGRTFEPGGGPGEGYGEGGDTPYGQMASGSSGSGLG
ncbi:MAG: hypothetical protein INR64_17350, partial [Caulobacteraceae bacterium]|nr:hypothetical protein [Caulobacter sp.]